VAPLGPDDDDVRQLASLRILPAAPAHTKSPSTGGRGPDLVPDRGKRGKINTRRMAAMAQIAVSGLAWASASYNVPHMAVATAPANAPAILPAGTDIGAVTLRISDADNAIRWYGDMMGMELVDRTPERLSFGAGGKAFLFL